MADLVSSLPFNGRFLSRPQRSYELKRLLKPASGGRIRQFRSRFRTKFSFVFFEKFPLSLGVVYRPL